MSMDSQTPCIFCRIVNNLEATELLYEDDNICVFRDIKPASRFHILTVPKIHIQDVTALTAADKDLISDMLYIAKEQVVKHGFSIDDARFGYHWPPFRSVKHLHLHTIAPESEMGYISRFIFKKDSFCRHTLRRDFDEKNIPLVTAPKVASIALFQ